ncbi:MAG: septal ring factor EnvC (AmiA/AmiB activator), partial [Gammaproteobacteria bacterium]
LMSLYGHNRSLNKTVGDHVSQHELISHMGDTAGLRFAALYFEIRHNGKPQDPLKWCKA